MSRLRTRLAAAGAGILLTLSALAGCAGAPPDLQESTAAGFQLAVFDVTTAAKEGDYVTAQAALDALQADLLTAAAAEQVSGTRSAEIQSAINLVRTDLAAAIRAAEMAAAQAAADAAAKEAAEAAAEAVRNAPAPPGDDKGNDDNKGEDGGDKGKDDDCTKDKDDC